MFSNTFRNNANSLIQDADNMSAIYYAVLKNDVITIQTFLQFPNALNVSKKFIINDIWLYTFWSLLLELVA